MFYFENENICDRSYSNYFHVFNFFENDKNRSGRDGTERIIEHPYVGKGQLAANDDETDNLIKWIENALKYLKNTENARLLVETVNKNETDDCKNETDDCKNETVDISCLDIHIPSPISDPPAVFCNNKNKIINFSTKVSKLNNGYKKIKPTYNCLDEIKPTYNWLPPNCVSIKYHFILKNINILKSIFDHFVEDVKFIVMDPPWPSQSVKRSKCYSTNDTEDISILLKNVPVNRFRDTSVGIWITNNPKIKITVIEDIFHHWGCTLIGTIYWLKITSNLDPVTPLRNKNRLPYEQLLIGSFQKKKLPIDSFKKKKLLIDSFEKNNNIVNELIISKPESHSRKPCPQYIFNNVPFLGGLLEKKIKKKYPLSNYSLEKQEAGG
eukprot:GHVL01028179.1.p1 GENE.GHVL01028179.1~~GHVL01028179.1.p1  ORF type:complete len:382 (+),score=107.38 GHVL01028179.1:1309-2454(+)